MPEMAWVWILFGLVLIAFELAVLDMLFILVLVGVSALLVGFCNMVFPEMSLSAQFGLFAVISVAVVIMFRRRLYESIHTKENSIDFEDTFVGGEVVLSSRIAANGTGRVIFRGGGWDAKNTTDIDIEKNTQAIVVGLESSCLLIKPLDRQGDRSEPDE
ncbi:MAG: hypothetical protein GKR90_25590 [Pseudomonadales bacterium]|nr:hypothetical protein [Pseudomonadales bacterium]